MGGFVFYGLGIGMGYYPILKTTWKYFPEKKGFLTGLILCVQLLMFPLDNIVSTDNNQVVVEDDNKPKDAIETNVSNEIYASEKYGKDTNKENEEENKKVVVNEPFMQAFKSLRFHLFNFMSVGTLCK